ncbi:hypothetical protein HPP92_027799 [Vanilla planifolia]|uniref:Uncharacterized protein n=1 Tax=Vanilla planifolia TaxID=51239 RepID=A0A835P8K6_VANPL|nr:hypothetical protein HPP92_027799 [Vanilla planifolia]
MEEIMKNLLKDFQRINYQDFLRKGLPRGSNTSGGYGPFLKSWLEETKLCWLQKPSKREIGIGDHFALLEFSRRLAALSGP